MINVLLVDDHDLVRTSLRMILNKTDGIKVVGEASSGEEAIRSCRETTPDVILMDLKMGGIGGVEATRKILRNHPQIKIIILTNYNNDVYPNRLINIGALGYLTKGTQTDEIVRAIRKVYAGEHYMSHEIVHRLAFKFHGKGTFPFDDLSERELQIMMLLVEGMMPQDIATNLCISTKTVNTYRYQIFEKLKVSGDVELALLAIQHGLLEPDDI